MTDAKPRSDEKEVAQFRRAAIESLKDAARQSDPREFDRLTRQALDLIARARAIEHGWRREFRDRVEPEDRRTVPAGLRYFVAIMNWRGEI